MRLFKSLLHHDHLVLANSLTSRMIFAGTQFLSTALAAHFLEIYELGYYFSFISILALFVIFELGLSQVIVISIASASVNSNKGHVENEQISSAVKAGFRQYIIAMVSFLIFITIGGFLFLNFAHAGDNISLYQGAWILPWILAVSAYGLRFILVFIESWIEGTGGIAEVITTRSIAQLVWICTFLLSLISGLHLYVIGLSYLVLVGFSVYCYRLHMPDLIAVLRSARPSSDAERMRPVPLASFQKQVSLTWIASYAITNIPVLVGFALLGAADAAKLGIALQIGAAIGVLSAALTTPRMALASRHEAEGRTEEFAQLFLSTLTISAAAAILAAIAGMILVISVPLLSAELQAKLPTPVEALPFVLASLCYAFMASVAVFSRATLREVFAYPLGIAAVMSVAGSVFLAHPAGILGLGLAQLLPALLVVTPIAIRVALRLLRRHKACETAGS